MAWSIVYLLLLLSLSTPLIIVTTLFLIIPAALLFATLNNRQFILHILPILLIVGLITPVYVLIAAYFLIPALVMGHWYRKRASAMSTLIAGTVTILGEFLLLLLLGTVLFDFSLSAYINDYVSDLYGLLTSPLSGLNTGNPLATDLQLSADDISKISTMTLQIIPMMLILSSMVLAVITHIIVRPILNSMEYAVPKLKPARDWRIPRSFIWYYLLAVIVSMLFGHSDSGFIVMITLNLLPLLRLAFKVQTIGFLFFLVHERKWSKFVAVVLAIPVLLLPGLWIIGVIDTVFPLREYVKKSKR